MFESNSSGAFHTNIPDISTCLGTDRFKVWIWEINPFKMFGDLPKLKTHYAPRSQSILFCVGAVTIVDTNLCPNNIYKVPEQLCKTNSEKGSPGSFTSPNLFFHFKRRTRVQVYWLLLNNINYLFIHQIGIKLWTLLNTTLLKTIFFSTSDALTACLSRVIISSCQMRYKRSYKDGGLKLH